MDLHYATRAQLATFKVAGQELPLCNFLDDELEENIALAERIVESYVNTIFYEIEGQTIYFDGNGKQNIFIHQLLNYPIISASTCTEVNEADEVLWTYTEGVDFVVTPWYLSKNWNDLSARLGSGSTGPTWPRGCRNIKVTGNWGRAEVPVEVKKATLYLAAEICIPGSSGLAKNNISKHAWDDYRVEYRGGTQKSIEPSDTTGFDFIDMILDKWRFKPDMFLIPDTHIPVFSTSSREC